MSALPPPPLPPDTTASGFEESTWERRARNRSPSVRWIGWRLRGLVVAALLGCLAMFLLLRLLAGQPALQAGLVLDLQGQLRLAGEDGQPRSAPLAAIVDAQGQPQPLDTVLLQRSARWLAADEDRARLLRQHAQLATALASGAPVSLLDTNGEVQVVDRAPHTAVGLGWWFWLLSTLALLLYLVTLVVVLSRPEPRNLLYAAMALPQVGNLLFIAALSTPALGWPAWLPRADVGARTVFDLVTAAALVHVTNLHPRRLPGGTPRSLLAWAVAAIVAIAVLGFEVTGAWWWTQAALLAGCALATAQLAWVHRRQAHPTALVLLRFCAVALTVLLLLTAIVSALKPLPDTLAQAATTGSTVWAIFLAAMLLLLPFISRTHALMREFSLLAGVSTVATALDLLFVALFSLGNFASLTLALFISLGLYTAVRQGLLARMMARERLTTERMFEHLYRAAREAQLQRRDGAQVLEPLLRELFDPLHLQAIERQTQRARVVAEGTSLVVPLPRLARATEDGPQAIILGFAGRGRRLFTEDDARLADRIVDLISRAVAFDQAVERGRSEERVRIAQDLHDDIGARLLTLMYRAPNPEMEDYVRHTLKDLKTLTRGLAAPSHRLSHAVAEWKADLQQRVQDAGGELSWSFSHDRDFELGVGDWSALTRVLRELINNALAHARATRIEVQGRLAGGELWLRVADDGEGRAPERWSHGLGLGGVRKRIKQLGGQVQWIENAPRGIACEVRIGRFGPAA